MVTAFILTSIFTSVELCTITIVVAATIIGFLIKPKDQSPAFSYIFSADITPSDPTDDKDDRTIEIQALPDGSLLICRHNVMLPDGASSHITADIINDKLHITEKHSIFSAPISETPHDMVFKIDCLKAKCYHLRYEIPDSGLWCIAQIKNRDNYTASLTLQY